MRIVNLRRNHYCVTKALYDGNDTASTCYLSGMLFRPHAGRASLEAAFAHGVLWTDPPVGVQLFYLLDDEAALFESFPGCWLRRMYGWHKNGPPMNLSPHPGESLVQFWEPQDGHWSHSWPLFTGLKLPFLLQPFVEEPRAASAEQQPHAAHIRCSGEAPRWPLRPPGSKRPQAEPPRAAAAHITSREELPRGRRERVSTEPEGNRHGHPQTELL